MSRIAVDPTFHSYLNAESSQRFLDSFNQVHNNEVLQPSCAVLFSEFKERLGNQIDFVSQGIEPQFVIVARQENELLIYPVFVGFYARVLDSNKNYFLQKDDNVDSSRVILSKNQLREINDWCYENYVWPNLNEQYHNSALLFVIDLHERPLLLPLSAVFKTLSSTSVNNSDDVYLLEVGNGLSVLVNKPFFSGSFLSSDARLLFNNGVSTFGFNNVSQFGNAKEVHFPELGLKTDKTVELDRELDW